MANNLTKYLKGRGYPAVADRNSQGKPVASSWLPLGDVTSIEMGGTSESFKVKENVSGIDKVAVNQTLGADLTLRMQLRNFDPAVVALALFGVVADVVSGTVSTPEVFPSGLVVGDVVQLENGRGRISSLVVKDSTGSPLTLTLDTDYSTDGYGEITILNLGSYVQPFKAFSYAYSAIKRVPLLVNPGPERYLRIRLKNQLQKNTDGSFKQRHVDLFRCQFSPAETIALIQESGIATIPLTCAVSADDKRTGGSTTSEYGDFFFLDAE